MPAAGLHWKVMVEDTFLDCLRPQVESDGTVTSRVVPEGRVRASVGLKSGPAGLRAALVP